MTESAFTRFLVMVLVASGMPAAAAVTARGPNPDNPRAPWADRYAESRQGPEQTDRVAQTYKVGPDGSLDLTNISGDVHVTGDNGNEIKIEAVKRVRGRDTDSARELLRQYRIEVNNVGGRVEVRAMGSRGRGSVDFNITVPASAAVTVRTMSGDVIVTKVRGEVRAETISGDLSLIGTPNVPLAKTVSGTLLAKDVGSATALSLTTISGNIITEALKVRTLEANSVSGDLLLRGAQVERLEAKSTSGNIEFASPLARGGRYAFNSHSGNVRVAILNGAGFELDANTFSGSIRSDFPITLRTDPDSRNSRNSRGRTIRGSFGDAGAILSVRSFSGSVVVSKQ